MAGNTLGQVFRLTSFGESHGLALGGIVDGCPAGLSISEADIQKDLNRRRPGQNRLQTQRKESDTVQILSGIFEGKTTGTPIGFVIHNEDQRSRDYSSIKELFRPGHADYTYFKKYGFRDYRGGGRASARETVSRVAAGAIARKILSEEGIEIIGYVTQVGKVKAKNFDMGQINQNLLFCPDVDVVEAMEEEIRQAQSEHDSIGAMVEVIAKGLPVGLGEPVFDKLDAVLAGGMMSINAVKGVEIGAGFRVVEMKGSENCDPITPEGFQTNNAGGILGGISNGDDLIIRLALKPTSSISVKQDTIDIHGAPANVSTKGRHDPCVGIRAVPISEAMMALILADFFLRNKLSQITTDRP